MITDKSGANMVKRNNSFLERISMHIPLYRGYRERNFRRDVDREVRMAVSKLIKTTKVELENVHREVVETGDMVTARKVERIRNKVDTYNTKIEKAANGYSGIWASVKKEEQELEAVIEYDAKLIESADGLRKDAENIRNSIGDDVSKQIQEFERRVDLLIETYEGRELVLKGLMEA